MNDEIERAKADAADAIADLADTIAAKRVADALDDRPPVDPDPDPLPDDDEAFIVMKHHGQPDLDQLGLTEVKMYYESAVTSGGNPDKGKLQAAARASKGLVILEIESWVDSKNKKGRGGSRPSSGRRRGPRTS